MTPEDVAAPAVAPEVMDGSGLPGGPEESDVGPAALSSGVSHDARAFFVDLRSEGEAHRAAYNTHADEDGDVVVEATSAQEAVGFIAELAGIPAVHLEAIGST